MGKIFEAMYGADGDSVETETETGKQQEVVEETVENSVRRYPENLILPLGRTFDGNAKWRRDMRKVTINLMVQADPQEVGGKAVMFSGMSKNVGTSTVTAQVAKILAAEYSRHRVLVLDVREAGVSDAMTLDRAMMEGYSVDDVLSGCDSEGIFRMLVSSSDEQGRSAMISHQLREFISQAREHFDWVLLDMPKQGSTPLADSLGRVVDGVAIVANTGGTRVPAINAVEEDMEQLGINLLGVILNFRKYPIPSWLLRFL
jgi:Mrp family chromosome partitioning ATPase